MFDKKYTGIEALGIFTFALFFFLFVKRTFKLLYIYIIGPTLHPVDFKSYGQWALVTGCTDGIGKEYAKQLAAKGCNIVLVSRSADKLKATAQEIENEFKVTTKTIQTDFTSGDDIYSNIQSEIADLEIGILVNNVGISYLYPEYFLDLPDGEKVVSNLLKANIVSVTRMTQIVMPGMVAREKGIIVNIGSASSVIPSPLLTVYAATKAYVDKFTEGIRMEYSSKGIIVQAVLPGFVCSNMSGIRKSSLFAPKAQDFVKSALALVGFRDHTTGYVPHAVFVEIIRNIYSISETISVWLVIRSMENSRRKFLKKYKAQ